MKKITFIGLLTLLSPTLLLFGQNKNKEITLEDIFKYGKFRTSSIQSIKSMNDGERYCQCVNDSINIYSFKMGKLLTTILTANQLSNKGAISTADLKNFEFSPDESKILFATQTERIYRRSHKSVYYVYDLETKNIQLLSDKGKLRLPTFSPDGKWIAFIFENNIYLKNPESGQEFPVTTDGLKNHIINGSADWVYEEELDMSRAFYWSSDSKKIAFYRFDETNVMDYTLIKYDGLYPELVSYKYPKAGEANSLVDIYVYDLVSRSLNKINLNEDTDSYIPRIKWTANPEILSIQWMNRLQNELKIILANVMTGNTETIYHENNRYYIEITDNLIFLSDQEHFLFTSEQDGYNHIYLYDMLGNLEQQVTSGKWDVTELVGLNEEKVMLYYISAETSALDRDLWVATLDGKIKKKLSEMEGDNSVDFGKQFKYFVNTYSNANKPPLVTINKADGNVIRILEDNSRLADTLEEYNFGKMEFFNFQTSDNVTLNGWMIKPPFFDPSEKYPVLMYVYGGPGSQTVRNNWGRNRAWYQMLANKGIIIVSVDNRGTGARGEEFKKTTYLQLGKYETLDQIEAAKYLSQLEYIDGERIGIWGWSYGGYVSSLCLEKGADVFNMAIAVAPVTNWKYYDNIYTERFMRTPQENPEGFEENSPINHVEKIKGNYLLVHGLADDNVHFQNSAEMMMALVAANKQFESQYYPNNNHGIYTGRNTTLHLYTRLTEFIEENLLSEK